MGESTISRTYLRDWILTHGCQMEALSEHQARVVLFHNPKTGGSAFLNLPIDERPVKEGSVYGVCAKLGIPVPTIL